METTSTLAGSLHPHIVNTIVTPILRVSHGNRNYPKYIMLERRVRSAHSITVYHRAGVYPRPGPGSWWHLGCTRILGR